MTWTFGGVDVQSASVGDTALVSLHVGDVKVWPTGPPVIPGATPSLGAYFDGAGDYVSTPNAPEFLIGSGDYTFEFWLKPGALKTSNLFSFRNGDTFDLSMYLMANGTFGVVISTNGTTWAVDSTRNAAGTPITANVWYHVALCKTGSVYKGFVNGIEQWSHTATGVPTQRGTTLSIGGDPLSAGGYYYHGYISTVRFSNTSLYSANFAVPAFPLTKTASTTLLCFQSGTVSDESSYNHPMTVHGDVVIKA